MEEQASTQNQPILAPITGRVKNIEEVNDPTFSQKMMGDGLAIEPSVGAVYAPVDGDIVQLFPTNHAIGMRTASGLEILIHIGLETVSMDGEGFEAHVQQGDQVQAGDLLITFDIDLITKKASSTICPVVVTNSDQWPLVNTADAEQVMAGQSVLMETEPALPEDKTEDSSGDDNQAETSPSSTGYNQQAKDIVAAVGGEKNVRIVTHCVTRLRFVLADTEQVNYEELDQVDSVKGFFSTEGQFQVVIGQGTVDNVYSSIIRETNLSEATKEDVKAASEQKQNILQRGVKTLADIFIPILPAIVTAGLLLGLNNLLVNPLFSDQPIVEQYPQWSGLADMINVIANTAFTFLPALIGWSAVKRFGGNPLLGVVLGLILVHPDLMPANEYAQKAGSGDAPTWNLFGLDIQKMGYQGQVLPVLAASWVLAKLEIWLKKHVLDSLQLLVVAPVALLVTGFLSFVLIGPVTFVIGDWITSGVVAVFNTAPLLGGLLYGAIYGPLVITGMHHTFLAVDLQLIGSTGSTFLWPVLALSNIAQGSAVFAIMLATRDEKVKGLAGTSGISAWLGVTEPAMFGVNLRYKFPFVAAVVGTSIAAGFITQMGVEATSIGVGGIPAFLSIVSENWLSFFIGMAIVIVIPFLITYIMAKRRHV